MDTSHKPSAQESEILQQMMSLGGSMIPAVAHEVATPIGVSLTASSLLKEQADTLLQALQNGQLKKSMLEEFIQEVLSAQQMIDDNLQRSSQIMKAFKQLNVDQQSLAVDELHLSEWVNNLLLSHRNYYKNKQIKMSNRVELGSFVRCQVGLITFILVNTLQFIFSEIFNQVDSNGQLICKVDSNEEGLAFTLMVNPENGPELNESKQKLDSILEPAIAHLEEHTQCNIDSNAAQLALTLRFDQALVLQKQTIGLET